jgi:hypothetical protein
MFSRVDTVAESERQWKISLAQRPAVSDFGLDLSSAKGTNVLHFGTFRDKYFFIGDKTAKLDCWSCEPYITFADCADPTAFPCTELPPTTSFLGAEAYVKERRIVVATYYSGDDAQTPTVNIYIYSVEEDFSCTVQQVHTFCAAECGASSFLGRLCSADPSTHAVVFGDVCNNPYFTFGTLTAVVGGASAQSLKHMKPLRYDHISDVFFKPDGTYYSARAHPVGENAVVVLVTANDDNYIAFERVVVLPFALGAEANGHIKCSVLSLKRMVTETGAIERLLVRLTFEQVRGGDGDEEGKPTSPRAVAFLLNIPTNEVVCKTVLRGPYGLCAVSADGQSIVQMQV